MAGGGGESGAKVRVRSSGRIGSGSYSHSYTQGSLVGAMFKYGPFQTMFCIITIIGLTCAKKREMIFWVNFRV